MAIPHQVHDVVSETRRTKEDNWRIRRSKSLPSGQNRRNWSL